MKIIRKVQMIVWIENKAGLPEFFAIKRKKQHDCVILTGKIGDKPEIRNETKKAAALRELKEELNISPENIVDLDIENKAQIKDDLMFLEYPFLIKIKDKNIHFVEYKAEELWLSKEKILKNLTYDTQKLSVRKALEIIS